jgi:hypothetical protein
MNDVERQNILVGLINDVFLDKIFGYIMFIIDEEGIELVCH